MTYTEDEARERWCPFFVEAAINRPEGMPQVCCIASQCMVWRWAQKRNPDWKAILHPDDEQPLYIEDGTRGYCGLAGKP